MKLNSCMRYLNVGLPEDILRYKLSGDLDNAIRLIDKRLAAGVADEALEANMIAEREMMLRTPADFTYTRETALAKIRELIPDFTDEEFDERVDLGTIRWIFLKGEPHYFKRFLPTLIKTEPEFARRAGKVPVTTAAQTGAQNPLDRCIRIMKEKGSMSCRIKIRAAIKANDEFFTPGAKILAHLPIPAKCATQSDIVIEKLSPEGGIIDPEDAEQRTVHWEGNYSENQEFEVVYSYTHTEQYHQEGFVGEKDPDAYKHLGEIAPHLMFTPYLRNLAAEITRDAVTPYEKARSIYDFITTNMKYTYMPSYFTLESIAENCARSRTGDCGVFTLLFITLCRICGIPACWESGLDAEPEELGAHDWARFYVEPYGWLHADPSYGVSSCRVGNEERRNFYFGNLEPYRMVANREFQADFIADKEGWRADPYDNQYGEIEVNGRGMDFGEYEDTQETLLHEEV